MRALLFLVAVGFLVGCGGGGGAGVGTPYSPLFGTWRLDSISLGTAVSNCPASGICGPNDLVTFGADGTIGVHDSLSGANAVGTYTVSNGVLTLDAPGFDGSTNYFSVTSGQLILTQIQPSAGLTYSFSHTNSLSYRNSASNAGIAFPKGLFGVAR